MPNSSWIRVRIPETYRRWPKAIVARLLGSNAEFIMDWEKKCSEVYGSLRILIRSLTEKTLPHRSAYFHKCTEVHTFKRVQKCSFLQRLRSSQGSR